MCNNPIVTGPDSLRLSPFLAPFTVHHLPPLSALYEHQILKAHSTNIMGVAICTLVASNCPGSKIKIRPSATNATGTEMVERKTKMRFSDQKLQVLTDEAQRGLKSGRLKSHWIKEAFRRPFLNPQMP